MAENRTADTYIEPDIEQDYADLQQDHADLLALVAELLTVLDTLSASVSGLITWEATVFGGSEAPCWAEAVAANRRARAILAEATAPLPPPRVYSWHISEIVPAEAEMLHEVLATSEAEALEKFRAGEVECSSAPELTGTLEGRVSARVVRRLPA